mmetsp:Transcript_14689/g.25113  ORF Transcript_14689/g.25113 Transcript_14689/m.25113 type:complete len:127 (+) Transcript_14689:34-414(+)
MSVHAADVLRLYRSFLVIGRRWPREEGRNDMGLGNFILKRTKEEFRLSQHEIDEVKAAALIEGARTQIAALEAILDNRFLAQYPRENLQSELEISRSIKKFLTRLQQKQPKKESFLMRLKSMFARS